ncbi:MAG: hypothetical protein A4E53_01472 [Pelotomaculum sp. PtaB.Bin104]|nr:MAG: hypothetical protein A4E53_01472 [Pelotomaculum sp. PtaB.Bin104]
MGKPKISKKKAFLAAFSKTGNVTRAAEIAKITRRQHYRWLEKEPAYVADFKEAEEEAADRLEAEARRRAEKGTLKPVFYKGQRCGSIREYSDTLLIFLLNGARPDKYKKRVVSEQSGPGGGPIDVRYTSRTAGLSAEEREALLAELRQDDDDPADILPELEGAD